MECGEPCGCEESVRLRAELETAREELANGVAVMNARQAHDRAEIAQLKDMVHALENAKLGF